jgi:hypothetical protein
MGLQQAARAATETLAYDPRRRSRAKSHRHYSIESGPYQVPPSICDMVREIGQLPYRDDVAMRVQAGAVLVLRHRGGPASMARWSEFPLPIRYLADRLGCTKAAAETVLKYLEGEIIQRVALEQDIFGRDRIEKRQLPDGTWINKPIMWRFTEKFRVRLERLHGFRPRYSRDDIRAGRELTDRVRRRIRKSDISKSSLFDFLGKYKDPSGLASYYLGKIQNNLPMSELRLRTVKRWQKPPTASPSRVAVVADTSYAPLESALAAISARVNSATQNLNIAVLERACEPQAVPVDVPRRSAADLVLARLRRRSEGATQRAFGVP